MVPKNKRQHKTLTLAEKCKILDSIESGKSLRKVGEQFNVSKSTIFDIKAKRDKIRKHVSQTVKGSGKLLHIKKIFIFFNTAILF